MLTEQRINMILDEIFGNKIKVYAFVGPSGTGKSYRAQMVASEKNINYIIDDGLLIKENEVIAGESAKKAPTKVGTVKHALFYEKEENMNLATIIQNTLNNSLKTTREIKPIPSKTYMYDKLTIPGVLIECGFLSNYEEKNKEKT